MNVHEACAVRQCGAPPRADVVLDTPAGERRVALCGRHVALAAGGALWLDLLRPPVPGTAPQRTSARRRVS